MHIGVSSMKSIYIILFHPYFTSKFKPVNLTFNQKPLYISNSKQYVYHICLQSLTDGSDCGMSSSATDDEKPGLCVCLRCGYIVSHSVKVCTKTGEDCMYYPYPKWFKWPQMILGNYSVIALPKPTCKSTYKCTMNTLIVAG